MDAMASQPFWAVPAEIVLGDVGSSSAGLSADEAGTRLRRVGPNEPAPPRRFEALRGLGAFLLNPLVLILLVASAVSAAFGQVVSSAIIASMVLLSIALNFSQSYQSQLAAQRLRDRVGHRATVLRDGRAQEIPAREVVPGDVVRLSAGDLVPGDGRLLSSRDLFLNEAALTGESLPREKHADAAVTPGASVEEAATAVLQGTSVVSGLGEAVVVRTGARTEFGQVAARLAGPRPRSQANGARVGSVS
jgi:Mg2+-importing ATPase